MDGTLRTDVCIVGAGPGGSATALQLAKRGVDALLIDKATFPRDKVCGDALSGKVMRTLERLDPALAGALRGTSGIEPSWGVTFVAPDGRFLRVPFSRTIGLGDAPGAILPRLRFDDLLAQAAKRAPGIRLMEGVEAASFTRSSDGWVIALKPGTHAMREIRARAIIAADGANSHFARHVAGLPLEPRHHCAGVRAYYTGVTGLDPQGFIELMFLRELLPGYLWIFPLPNGRANVGLGLRSDVVKERRADLKAMLDRLLHEHPDLKHRFAKAQREGPIQGMGLPLASKRWSISGDHFLLVGDAAHLIDPFTGEGISHAMISGVHAADVVADALRDNALDGTRLKEYDARVWKRLGKELTISTRLQRLANRPWLFNLVVSKATRNPALADTISSMFNDLDLRERLKSPRFYVDLLLGRSTKGRSA